MKLTWTKTDEAPALASYALLPILRAYCKGTGVEIETADISLAGRIIANFPECLRDDQRIPDELTRLGRTETRAREEQEIAVTRRYLPQMVTENGRKWSTTATNSSSSCSACFCSFQ